MKRRKPLRRVSKKRAALLRAIGPERRSYLQEFRVCAFPNCGKRSVCIHEIAFGSGIRSRAYAAIETWLPSCADHNRSGSGFHNPLLMPIANQLAVKRFIDFDNYDLAFVNECRWTVDGAITEQEVREAYELLYGV